MAKPIGSMRAWQLAQAGFARCCSIACRIVKVSPAAFPSVLSAGTLGGGGGGGDASRFCNTYFPRKTGDVRVEYDVSVKMLPCPNKPPRGLPAGNVTWRK